MDHDDASQRLTDWVAGRLAEPDAAAVAAHVAGCAACREVAEAVRGVRAAVAEHGEHLFSAHPLPEALARFALAPDAVALPELSALRGHLAACPTCERELALVRAANGPAPLRALRAWVPARGAGAALLRPALAVLVALLAVPAWLGIVELPRERARARQAVREAAVAPAPVAREAAPAWAGGAVDLLVLSAPTRGAEGEVPLVRLRPGQPAVPLLVELARPRADSLTLRAIDAAGVAAWSLTTARDELWDVRHGGLSALVPAAALGAGAYRLEVAPAGGGAPLLVARFRVAAAAARGPLTP